MTIEGCDKLISKLERVSDSLSNAERQGGLHDYMRGVWDAGYTELEKSYANALTLEGEPANQDTTIVSEPTIVGNTFELTAMGNDIMFLEFGTGLNMSDTNPYASKFWFYPGSYSERVGKGFLAPPKLYHFHGAWPHNKKFYRGQNPAKGMYNAYKAMEEYARTVPLRIFNDRY